MIPFAPPRIDQAIIDEVTATLKTGWITTGPRTKLFEKKLTEFCGNKATICLNSATAGLEIMLRWFGVGEGDEVILPAYTYAATANVVIHCGAIPVLVDVGADFNMDCNLLKKAVSSRTKVIMPVDFGGYPCDYHVIMKLVAAPEINSLFTAANENQEKLGRIMVLSDAAHSFGATYKGKRTGQLADVSVFSFHAVKNLTTAEGGAVALNLPAPFDNTEIYNYLCVYTLHGQNKDALSKMQKGNWKYDVVMAGYKCNMTDIAAAIGLVELSRYENDMLVKRKHICDSYNSFFNKFNWAQLPPSGESTIATSFHLYPLRIKGITEPMRDAVIQKIFDKDVSVNVHFIPLPLLTFYRNMGMNMSEYPVSYDNYSREISLPVFYGLTDIQLSTVCEAVSKSVDEILAVKST